MFTFFSITKKKFLIYNTDNKASHNFQFNEQSNKHSKIEATYFTFSNLPILFLSLAVSVTIKPKFFVVKIQQQQNIIQHKSQPFLSNMPTQIFVGSPTEHSVHVLNLTSPNHPP